MKLDVLGAGQLGRMLALAGYPLGLHCRFLDPAPGSPAGQVAEQIVGDYDDPHCLDRFLHGLTAVTYEFENVPVERARAIARHCPVWPPPLALEVSQDRLREKTMFRELGIPTPPFVPVETRAELDAALAEIGHPAVLKTRRLGYDGKGQFRLRTPEDAEHAWAHVGGVPLIVEGFVAFQRELSLLAVRGQDGSTAFYPLVENHHDHGILRTSKAPAKGVSESVQKQVQDYGRRLLDRLGYVGVLAVEFFEERGRLLANEIAPRVHNSGHWSIEGAVTSQFENHLRAIAGWPLGDTSVPRPCAMLNLIGDLPDPAAILAVPEAHLHLYGKMPRPGRKVGHVTVLADLDAQLEHRLDRLRGLLPAEESLYRPGPAPLIHPSAAQAPRP
jgi:5-(carboxyamino)imidazole ribonucleotide synthase